MSAPVAQRPPFARLAGRVFVHPSFDYLLIGGGLSLIVTALVVTSPHYADILDSTTLPYFILLSNSAHFAASTVRLYTKPGAYDSRPFVTMGLPLVTLLLLTVCIFQAGRLGPFVQTLYLTWSPYHYAAQAYGLAVMYSYRSGCKLHNKEKAALWWISMLPFFYAFFVGKGIGLDWLVPASILDEAWVDDARRWSSRILIVLAFATPPLLVYRVWRSGSGVMPLISMMVLVSNGIWWFVLPPLGAFAWGTIFHGIQYLAIVIIFHLKDQMRREGNVHGRLYHALWFYGACLLLGYGLFNVLPLAYQLAGFGRVESLLLVVATVNIHHFIVDAYIWRLKQTDSNRRIVDADSSLPEVSSVT